jgi:hypothetical protein
MPDPIDVLTILDPITPELRRALQAVLAVGFGQVTLHVRNNQVKLVSWTCSSKPTPLTDTTGCGNIIADDDI